MRRSPVTVGPQEIIGMQGVVRDGGLVFVRGELWRARSPEPLAPGQRVEVDRLDGLTLTVHPGRARDGDAPDRTVERSA